MIPSPRLASLVVPRLSLSSRSLCSMAQLVVPVKEATRYMVECMTAVGCANSHAQQLAAVLIAGDYRGHYSHGLNRLDMYVRDIQTGMINKDGCPKLLEEKAATGWVDGGNLLGPVVGNFCTELALKKASETGIGWVVAKNSNHFGIAGYYPLKMMEKGMLGMAFTNTSPIVFPSRSAKGALGTNPIALGAPAAKDGDNFVLDMATSTVAIGKVELAGRKGEQVRLSFCHPYIAAPAHGNAVQDLSLAGRRLPCRERLGKSRVSGQAQILGGEAQRPGSSAPVSPTGGRSIATASF